MYEEDDILMEKWAREEKEKRQKLYESAKPKRNIEGSQTFGYVKETQDVQQLHKNTVNMSKQEQKAVENQEEDIEKYFEGMSDEQFTKAVSKQTDKRSEIARLKKEASRHITMTEKDKKLKALAELDSDQGALAKGEELFKEEKRIVGK